MGSAKKTQQKSNLTNDDEILRAPVPLQSSNEPKIRKLSSVRVECEQSECVKEEFGSEQYYFWEKRRQGNDATRPFQCRRTKLSSIAIISQF